MLFNGPPAFLYPKKVFQGFPSPDVNPSQFPFPLGKDRNDDPPIKGTFSGPNPLVIVHEPKTMSETVKTHQLPVDARPRTGRRIFPKKTLRGRLFPELLGKPQEKGFVFKRISPTFGQDRPGRNMKEGIARSMEVKPAPNKSFPDVQDPLAKPVVSRKTPFQAPVGKKLKESLRSGFSHPGLSRSSSGLPFHRLGKRVFSLNHQKVGPEKAKAQAF
ncbi:Conserved hypothetical protein [Methylacidiphilum infernorum V4]|uniref:Uncharacterized protein n=1 Tax=Methylacidiphilum infernorum (isolate V4) TaxID=481448 RepID=B3E0C0_METI4|nr:Conserved hypothetical protein [Methylacidiphilum infernorum V4]